MAYRSATLAVADGGTGATTLTGVLIGNGTSAVTSTNTPTITSVTFGSGSALSAYVAAGTWTPVLQFGGASVGITYGTQTGTYTQIGNVIFVSCIITLTNKGSSTGAASIIGFPFTIGSTSVNMAIPINDFSNASITGFVSIYGQCAASSTGIALAASEVTGAVSALSNTNFTNTTSLSFTGYFFNS